MHELGDDALAEKYCRSLYKQDSEAYRDIYFSLLRAYVSPPPEAPTRADGNAAALQLLTRYIERIDPARALEILPESSVGVSEIRSFLESSMRHHHDEQRNSQVL